MMNHDTTELFFDGLSSARRRPDRRGGQGLPLHPRRHERRADPDRRRVHRRRALVRREGDRVRHASASSSAARSAQNQGVQFPIARAHAALEAADLMRYKAAWLFERGEPCGAEANMAKLPRLRGLLGGGERLPRHTRRLRLRRGVRRRAQVPRDPPLPGRAGLEQPVLAYVGQHVLGMPRSY